MALIDEEHVPLEINDTTGEVRAKNNLNYGFVATTLEVSTRRFFVRTSGNLDLIKPHIWQITFTLKHSQEVWERY